MLSGRMDTGAQGLYSGTCFRLLVQSYFVLVLLSGTLSASVVKQGASKFSRQTEAGKPSGVVWRPRGRRADGVDPGWFWRAVSQEC